MQRAIVFLALCAAAACAGGGDALPDPPDGPALISTPRTLAAQVTLTGPPGIEILDDEAFDSTPGQVTDCAFGIRHASGWREDDGVFFSILTDVEVPDGCDEDRIYSIFLFDVVWRGRRGTIKLLTDPVGPAGFPDDEGVAAFFPVVGLPELVPEIVVTQIYGTGGDFIHLGVPVDVFAFADGSDLRTVFEVGAQIERPGGVVDYTETVNVDLDHE